MNRRGFLQSSLGACVSLVAAPLGVSGGGGEPARRSKPFIDSCQCDCYGGKIVAEIGPDGGFLVPEEFVSELQFLLLTNGAIWRSSEQ